MLFRELLRILNFQLDWPSEQWGGIFADWILCVLKLVCRDATSFKT